MPECEDPFSCSVKECSMAFTNENHYKWHQKKHEIMLTLGLTTKTTNNNNNSETADQTPTPTRFIRNCEEVGLFQDLQNVNPFDELFKKAIENTKSGDTIHPPQSTTDDNTLHTPQIYPHTDTENVAFASNDINQTTSNSLPVIIIDSDNENDTPQSQTPCETNDDVKRKIRNALKSKSVGSITPVPLHKLIRAPSGNNSSKESFERTRNNITDAIQSKWPVVDKNAVNNLQQVERLREMNRAAQYRCRKRKQKRLQTMENDIAALKCENKELRAVNASLNEQIKQLQLTLLRYTNESRVNCNPTTVNTIINPSRAESATVSPITSRFLLPKSSNKEIPSNNRVLVLVNPTSSASISVRNVVSISSTDKSTHKVTLRKIVPKCTKLKMEV